MTVHTSHPKNILSPPPHRHACKSMSGVQIQRTDPPLTHSATCQNEFGIGNSCSSVTAPSTALCKVRGAQHGPRAKHPKYVHLDSSREACGNATQHTSEPSVSPSQQQRPSPHQYTSVNCQQDGLALHTTSVCIHHILLCLEKSYLT